MSQTNPASQGQAGPNESISLLDLIQPTHCSVECLRFFEELLDSRPDHRSNQVEFTSPKFLEMLWQHILKSEALTHGAGGNNPFCSPESLSNPETWEEALERIAENPPSLSEGHLSKIRLTRDLAEVLAAARNLAKPPQPKVYPAHLLAAFVFRFKEGSGLLPDLPNGLDGVSAIKILTFLRSRLIEWKNSCDPAFDALLNRWIGLINGSTIGGCPRLDREASPNEDALNSDSYARALADLIREADNKEFTLGIFGHWGRGKTFLMRQLVLRLRAKTSIGIVRTTWDWLKQPFDFLTGKVVHSFETMTFSAWRYPSRPEVWVHLYETIAKAAYEAGFWKSLPCIIRAGVARQGYKQLLVAGILLAIALVPWGTRLKLAWDLAWLVAPALGLAGLVLLYHSYAAAKGAYRRLKASYLSPARHSEKLGLQATIGDDLAALLKGWFPNTSCGKVFYSLAIAWLLAVAGLVGWRVHGVSGQGSLYPWLAAFIVVIAGYLLCAWIFPWNPLRRKCLLIVDDLDRCEPGHLLAVMESVKLMLEDVEVSSRMVSCFLVDEDVLRHAIWDKYGSIIRSPDKACFRTTYDAPRLFRENVEKLFTVYLRLPPLQDCEVQALVVSFNRGPASPKQQAPSNRPAAKAATESRQASTTPSDQSLPTILPAKLCSEPENFDTLPHHFELRYGMFALCRHVGGPDSYYSYLENKLSDSEREFIANALFLYLKEKPETLLVGPRSVRAFIFRYQLVRLIFVRRGIADFDPKDVISRLAERTFGAASTMPKSSEAVSEVDAVLEMVT